MPENDDIIKKYKKRLVKRQVVKSHVWGLVVGFFAMLVCAIVLFSTGNDRLFWISFIVFAALTCASSFALYFLRFCPSDKDVAAAVDSLGLDERVITMVELEGSTSTISGRQRSDTRNAVKDVSAKSLKIIVLSTLALVLLIVAAVLGLGGTTYNILVYADVAPGIENVAESIADANAEEYMVIYDVYDQEETYNGLIVGDGIINGDRVQSVKEGENCTTVYAEAMPDSMFYMWSDGLTNPERTDVNVIESKEIYAVFVAVVEFDFEDLDGGSGSGEGDYYDSSDMGEEEDEDSASQGASKDTQGTGVGGGLASNGNVYDNMVDYNDEIDDAMDDVGEKLGSGNYGDYIGIIGDYFGGIHN